MAHVQMRKEQRRTSIVRNSICLGSRAVHLETVVSQNLRRAPVCRPPNSAISSQPLESCLCGRLAVYDVRNARRLRQTGVPTRITCTGVSPQGRPSVNPYDTRPS